MPTLPKRICSYPGCTALCKGSRCEKHPPRKGAADAPAFYSTSRQERGYGSDWDKLRRQVLHRDPFCTWPEGCHKPSTHVDHITPKAMRGSDDGKNLRGLCAHHHAIKTGQDTGRIKRARRAAHGRKAA